MNVIDIEDGGPVVSGTTDVEAAKDAVVAARADEHLPDELPAVRAGLSPMRVGWFRWNPCSARSCYDGGGHRVHLGYADGPGRGNWQGVAFR